MNPIQDAITQFGSITALAKSLEVTPQAICFWRDKKRQVPADRCPDIERLTAGVVTCELLRPDVDWAYIRGTAPELAQVPADSQQFATEKVAQG